MQSRTGPVRLTVRVRPSARRSAVTGYEGNVLKVDVAAPPAENRANEELIKLLARELAVGRSKLSIFRGQSSRDKVVEIDAPRELVEAWLKDLQTRCNPIDQSR